MSNEITFESLPKAVAHLIEEIETVKSLLTNQKPVHWWCIGEDNKSLFVLEQYDDADAAIAHIKANPPARADFFDAIEVVNVIIYCDLTDELKEMFKPLNPIFMSYYGGFSK